MAKSSIQTSKLRALLLSAHKVVTVIEPWGIVAAVVALIFACAQLWFDHDDRVEERVARAWQVLSVTTPGNSGKIGALEYLNREDGLFCSSDKKSCLIEFKRRTNLFGIDLSRATHASTNRHQRGTAPRIGVFLHNVNLQDALLNRSNFDGAELNGANLRHACLWNANFHNAHLAGADLRDAILRESKLTRARLDGTKLDRADLRGADLFGAYDLRQEQVHSACIDNTTRLPEGLTVDNALSERLCTAIDKSASLTPSRCRTETGFR